MNSVAPPETICAPAASQFRLLTDDERNASMLASMQHWQSGQDIWVFGYASLIWRPEFEFTEQRLGLIRGYHRSLCLWSRVNRGTPENPGLVFALDSGGSCRGMAFRVPSSEVPDTMQALWKREMSTGSYHPKWLSCMTNDGPVKALAFVMNRNTEGYVRGLSLSQLVSIIASAHGRCGPCTEYVLETARALQQSNIPDSRLQALVEHLHRLLPRTALQ